MILSDDRFVGSSRAPTTSVGRPQLTNTQFPSPVDQRQQLARPTASGWYGKHGRRECAVTVSDRDVSGNTVVLHVREVSL